MEYRNYSRRSIITYHGLLKNLCQKTGVLPEDLTHQQVKDYLHKRKVEENISVSTINQTIGAYRILQKGLLGKQWEPLKLARPRKERRLPVVLSKQEIEQILKRTKNIKHKAIIALAYSSGLRKEELRHLLPEHVDSKRMVINVRQGKGKKCRQTVLSQTTLDLLREYYKKERPVKYLFDSNMRRGEMLSSSTLLKIMKNAVARTGIIKSGITFHTLRHCFATHMLEQGINLKLLQVLLGHNSLKTTSIYLHIARIDMNKIVSPIDDMNLKQGGE